MYQISIFVIIVIISFISRTVKTGYHSSEGIITCRRCRLAVICFLYHVSAPVTYRSYLCSVSVARCFRASLPYRIFLAQQTASSRTYALDSSKSVMHKAIGHSLQADSRQQRQIMRIMQAVCNSRFPHCNAFEFICFRIIIVMILVAVSFCFYRYLTGVGAVEVIR